MSVECCVAAQQIIISPCRKYLALTLRGRRALESSAVTGDCHSASWRHEAAMPARIGHSGRQRSAISGVRGRLSGHHHEREREDCYRSLLPVYRGRLSGHPHLIVGEKATDHHFVKPNKKNNPVIQSSNVFEPPRVSFITSEGDPVVCVPSILLHWQRSVPPSERGDPRQHDGAL